MPNSKQNEVKARVAKVIVPNRRMRNSPEVSHSEFEYFRTLDFCFLRVKDLSETNFIGIFAGGEVEPKEKIVLYMRYLSEFLKVC